jgi:hypothetical protein
MPPEVQQENLGTRNRTVRLSDGRVVLVPNVRNNPVHAEQVAGRMGMGPVNDPPLVTFGQLSIAQPDDVIENPDLWAPEVTVPEPVKNDPKLERLMLMIGRVHKFLRDRDPHLFFRRVLPNVIHRQTAYSAWPKPLRDKFDQHFKTLLSDPVFIKGQVQTALSFEFGHGIAEQRIAELAIVCAGFLAYSLAGVEVQS